jgi:hypothetical protein
MHGKVMSTKFLNKVLEGIGMPIAKKIEKSDKKK